MSEGASAAQEHAHGDAAHAGHVRGKTPLQESLATPGGACTGAGAAIMMLADDTACGLTRACACALARALVRDSFDPRSCIALRIYTTTAPVL